MDDVHVNLLSEGGDAFNCDGSEPSPQENPIGSQPSPVHTDSPQIRLNNRRSKNFSEKEDNLLVSAWLNISINVIQGNQQPRATYWRRIHDYFHENKTFTSDRSQASLTHRWSVIQEAVNKFCRCYDRIERRNQNGLTEQDKIMQAKTLYQEEEGRSFAFLYCWNVLQHHPKWCARLSQKKQKTSSSGSWGSFSPVSSNAIHLDEDHPSAENDHLSRPIGHKAVKEQLHHGKEVASTVNLYMEALENFSKEKREFEIMKERKKDERFERLYALKQAKIELEKESLELMKNKLEFKKMIEEERIIGIDLSRYTEPQKQFYMSLQSDIIARRCNRSG